MTTSPAVAVIRRTLPAPPDVAYDEWLSPDALKDWMCPRPARCLDVQVDATVGGRVRFDIEDSGSTLFVTGHYLALDRPHRIVFTWSCSTWPDPSVQSIVTVQFEPSGDETLMTITHERLPSALVEQHQRGWNAIAEQLDRVLQQRAQS